MLLLAEGVSWPETERPEVIKFKAIQAYSDFIFTDLRNLIVPRHLRLSGETLLVVLTGLELLSRKMMMRVERMFVMWIWGQVSSRPRNHCHWIELES